MTLARVRRPTCEARSAARKASPITYTPPWKYRTTWRGSIPSTVISAVGTPPKAAAVTVTSAGSGCADTASRSSRRCSLTSLSTGKADWRRIASRVSRCSVLTEDLPSGSWSSRAPQQRRGRRSASGRRLRDGVTHLGPGFHRGRLRLDQHCGEDGTDSGGGGEDVERDLEAVRERGPAEGGGPGV